MKESSKNQSIDTIPEGVWESSRPADRKPARTPASPTTDLQGNGYPAPPAGRGAQRRDQS